MPAEYFFENDPLKTRENYGGLSLILDFDGTLVPIQGDPRACILTPDIKRQLEAIARSGNSSLAILSGRSLSDIQERVGIGSIYYGGSHGLEISGPHTRYVHPGALPMKPLINGVRRVLEREVEGIEGVLIEAKKFTFALHYRSASKTDGALARKILHGIVSGHPDRGRMAIKKGKQVLELAPDVLWDKGRAALFILHRLDRTYLPVYVGDDVTDEAAFRALEKKGITVRIGPSKRSAAGYYLKNQREISRFLSHISDAIHSDFEKGAHRQ
jgi:trehalose-phosphatase